MRVSLLALIWFAGSGIASATEKEVLFELTDGEVVAGEILQEGEDSYLVRTSSGDVVRISFDRVESVTEISVLEEGVSSDSKPNSAEATGRGNSSKPDRARAVSGDTGQSFGFVIGVEGDGSAHAAIEWVVEGKAWQSSRGISKITHGLSFGGHEENDSTHFGIVTSTFFLGDSRTGASFNAASGFVYDGWGWGTFGELAIGGKVTFNRSENRWRGVSLAGEIGITTINYVGGTASLKLAFGY